MNIICRVDGITCVKTDITEINLSTLYLIKNNIAKAPLVSLAVGGENDGIEFNYPILATLTGDNGRYYIYKLSCPTHLTEAEYRLSVLWKDDAEEAITQTTNITLSSLLAVTPDTMWDEHDHIIIHDDRSISNNNVVLLAEDSSSQLVTFEIDELYDGISVLDSTKTVQIEYLPVKYLPGEEEGRIFFDDSVEKERLANNSSIILLKWKVPPRVTLHAGTVRYAVAVIGTDGYVWQTKSSSFTILPNLGLRNTAIEPEVATSFKELENTVKLLRTGGDTTFAQHIGEYLATDSNEKTESEESSEIIFDAN